MIRLAGNVAALPSQNLPSSRSITTGRFMRARAMAILCFCDIAGELEVDHYSI